MGQGQNAHKQRYERGDFTQSSHNSPPLTNSAPNLYPGLPTHSARGHMFHDYTFKYQKNLISVSLVWNTNLALSVRALLLFWPTEWIWNRQMTQVIQGSTKRRFLETSRKDPP